MTSTKQDSTKRLDEALGRAPRSVEPGHDLWPAIEARLEPRGAGGRRRWVWQAAAAVLLVAGSSLLTASLVRREGARVARTEAPAAVPVVYSATYALDPEYVTARQQLSAMLAGRLDRLPASTRQKLEANLAEIRRATEEIHAALALQPGDPLLEELLLNTYEDELAVLAGVNQLAGTNGAAAPQDDKGMQL